MPSKPLRIMIVAGLCVLALIALVVRESMARASGTEVQMAMTAVDPRSLLSGNYIAVSLSEQLPPAAKCPATNSGDEWLSLRPEGPLYHVAAAAPSHAGARADGALPVRGTFICYDGTPASGDIAATPASLTADLGIHRFYINQKDAERISALLRNVHAAESSPVNAILSVGHDGRARLKGISVNGQRLNLSWL